MILPEFPKGVNISDIPNSLVMIHKIQDGQIKGYTKSLFVNSIVNKIKTRAKNTPEDAVVIINFIEDFNKTLQDNGYKSVISSRNSIWKVRDNIKTSKLI